MERVTEAGDVGKAVEPGVARERPILFSGPMVKAILDGRKSQTRRVVKGLPANAVSIRGPSQWGHGYGLKFGTYDGTTPYGRITCHYGQPGDRLWVRETWQPIWATEERPEWGSKEGWAIGYPATDGIQELHDEDKGMVRTCKPSIYMPRWASRITLEITGVRVERLQDISSGDARAEGVAQGFQDDGTEDSYEGRFRALWDSINGKRWDSNGNRHHWENNPWVWVLEFKRLGGA